MLNQASLSSIAALQGDGDQQFGDRDVDGGFDIVSECRVEAVTVCAVSHG